jgi:L-lactate permease
LSLLERWGGYLIRPRAHAATLGVDEGRFDAVGLGLLYAIGTSVYPIVEAFAGLLAVHDLGGLLAFATAFGRVVLPPLLVIVAVETVLGSARSHQRAAGLLPLVIVGTAAHAARQLGWALPGGAFAPDLVGGLLGLGLAWWIRDAIRPVEEGGE